MSQLVLATSHKAHGNLGPKHGTADEVRTSIEIFLREIGRTQKDCVTMDVTHGDDITYVDESNQGTIVVTEALLTDKKNIPLFLLTADCFPVVFHDPKKEVLALAHLGWRPIGKHLIKKVVARMQGDFNSNPEDIEVHIGPGIHKESYIFDVSTQKDDPNWIPFLTDLPDGRVQVDLVSYMDQQLRESGVTLIYPSAINTATSDKYFSHYRSVRTGEPEGRFATVCELR